jgi:hypothetical protein
MLNIVEADEKDEFNSPFRPLEKSDHFNKSTRTFSTSASKFINKPNHYVGKSALKDY